MHKQFQLLLQLQVALRNCCASVGKLTRKSLLSCCCECGVSLTNDTSHCTLVLCPCHHCISVSICTQSSPTRQKRRQRLHFMSSASTGLLNLLLHKLPLISTRLRSKYYYIKYYQEKVSKLIFFYCLTITLEHTPCAVFTLLAKNKFHNFIDALRLANSIAITSFFTKCCCKLNF